MTADDNERAKPVDIAELLIEAADALPGRRFDDQGNLIGDDRPIVKIEMTPEQLDESENWLRTYRLERLRERGWKGSLEEWVLAVHATGEDPLLHDPPITSLGEEDSAACRR